MTITDYSTFLRFKKGLQNLFTIPEFQVGKNSIFMLFLHLLRCQHF